MRSNQLSYRPVNPGPGAFAAVIAGVITAIRKRSSGKAEADLWHEATSGPGAVSTPTAR